MLTALNLTSEGFCRLIGGERINTITESEASDQLVAQERRTSQPDDSEIQHLSPNSRQSKQSQPLEPLNLPKLHSYFADFP